MSTDTSEHTAAMTKGRHGDSTRRRQRVLKALNDAVNEGEEISVTGIARRAGVDRTFLYRHGDLLEQVHAMEAQPPNTPGVGPAVSRASLHADLLNAQQRAGRLASRVQQLEHRLSEALGEQAWRESGLGTPDDIDRLEQQVVLLEQEAVDLRLQLEERDQDLVAARAANRAHDPAQHTMVADIIIPAGSTCTTPIAIVTARCQRCDLQRPEVQPSVETLTLGEPLPLEPRLPPTH